MNADTDTSNLRQNDGTVAEKEVKNLKVELTVVGIRNYCPDGEDGLPDLFARLPIGSNLFLSKNPTGTKYSNAVSVFDDIGTTIGNISKTDRRFIELAIPKDGMLPCIVTGHSIEHHCLYVEAENNVGFKEPYIRKTTAEEGELIFNTTDEDDRLQLLTKLLLTQLGVPDSDRRQLLELAKEYAKICCTSLDGESVFACDDVLRLLKNINDGSGMFDEVISSIYEKKKDLGRTPDDVKTKVYRSQYDRIFASAHKKRNGKPSELESYVKSLDYCHAGELSVDVIRAEVKRLSQLLAKEFMNTFVKASETDEDFANALYSFNYSLRSIYIMYTRRIKREYLLSMLEKNPFGMQVVNADEMSLQSTEASQSGSEDDITRRSQEERFHFIHPEVDSDDEMDIHQQVERLVGRFGVREICEYLDKMAVEKKILLPQSVKTAYDELVRMGMPDGEGYAYKTFEKYYRK